MVFLILVVKIDSRLTAELKANNSNLAPPHGTECMGKALHVIHVSSSCSRYCPSIIFSIFLCLLHFSFIQILFLVSFKCCSRCQSCTQISVKHVQGHNCNPNGNPHKNRPLWGLFPLTQSHHTLKERNK